MPRPRWCWSKVSTADQPKVLFNAPFYSGLGLVELSLDEAPSSLRDIFNAEVPAGIDPLSRVLMIRPRQDG
jgi:hypothetical protein